MRNPKSKKTYEALVGRAGSGRRSVRHDADAEAEEEHAAEKDAGP